MTPDDILDQLSTMTAHQIADLIRRGTVSLDFLEAEGGADYPVAKRKEVRRLLDNSESEDWIKTVATDTYEAYQDFIDRYPNSTHRTQALETLERLKPQPEPEPLPQQPVSPDEEAWQKISKRNKRHLQDFIAFFPDSIHINEAKQFIAEIDLGPAPIELMKQRMAQQTSANGRVNIIREFISSDDYDITADNIYEEIRKDHNWLAQDEVKGLVTANVINYYDLMSRCLIDADFIRYLNAYNAQAPSVDTTYREIDRVPDGSTEIYFWGIPSSGKTCTIGAVMSSLRNGNVVEYTNFDSNSQGYNYMNQLSMLFSNVGGQSVFQLPPGNPIDGMFVMRCDVVRQQRSYPLTFVDVAGESLISMYMKMSNIPLDPRREEALDKLSEIVSDNTKKMTKRKIHFFVIEYGGHDRLITLPNGSLVDQMTLLDGVKNYINQYGDIFNKATDAIYILMTKSDIAGPIQNRATQMELKNYIRKYYSGFYKSLVGVCRDKKYQINKGEVTVMPFTLGDVCFQSLCKFNPLTAHNVINTILERVWFEKIDKTSKFFGHLKK